MGNSLALELANEIFLSLKKEFAGKHLTNNLIDRSYIIDNGDYVELHISAPSYDFYEYFINGVIVPPKKAGLPTQYASLLDTQGSEFTVYWVEPSRTRSGKISSGRGNIKKAVKKPHNHVGYVNTVLSEGISNWVNRQNLDIKVEQ